MSFLSRLLGNHAPPSAEWRAVRSMITPAEREHLYEAAAKRYTGTGAIIDLGTWLGGSTAAMAAGLAANRSPEARRQQVHAFDRFEMNAYMKKTYSYPELADIPVGGSFLQVFERNMAPWASRIVAHPGDLTAYKWTGGPIELMHVDIMKNWALTNAVLRTFFTELIPGRSIILHQDYVHYNTVWIHLVMYRLRDHFEPLGQVPGSTTFEFRLRSAIPTALLEHTYGFEDFSPEEERAAFAWSRSLLTDPFAVLNIDAAEAMLHLHKGDRVNATRLLTEGMAREDAWRASDPKNKRRSELHQVKLRLEATPA